MNFHVLIQIQVNQSINDPCSNDRVRPFKGDFNYVTPGDCGNRKTVGHGFICLLNRQNFLFFLLLKKPALEGPVGIVKKALYSNAVDQLDHEAGTLEDCNFGIDLLTLV